MPGLYHYDSKTSNIILHYSKRVTGRFQKIFEKKIMTKHIRKTFYFGIFEFCAVVYIKEMINIIANILDEIEDFKYLNAKICNYSFIHFLLYITHVFFYRLIFTLLSQSNSINVIRTYDSQQWIY